MANGDSTTVTVPPPAPIKPGPDPNRYPGGYAEQGTDNSENRKFLWVGVIIYVDYETMVCSIRFETGNSVEHDVPIPAMGGAGPRSWSGSMPERGSKVICSWRKFGDRFEKPHIVAYLSAGTYAARNYEPFSTIDPDEAAAALEQDPELQYDPTTFWNIVRLKSRKIYPGEFVASSVNGSDLILDRDVTLQNRSLNEFRLRDADQTAVLSALNEYTSNAAGTYQRGIIKRNAFVFTQEAYFDDSVYGLTGPTAMDPPYTISDKAEFDLIIQKASPSYDVLRSLGLIDEAGRKTFTEEFTDNGVSKEYPYIVYADGSRTSVVTADKNMFSFDKATYAYVEDRKEIRHVSGGVLPVSEDVDGFTIDNEKELYIEDVHGTVVGNDFSPTEQKNYKKILSLKTFSNKDIGELSPSPNLVPINMMDPVASGTADDLALARLYRLKSPTTGNEYAFGISKQGKVSLHIPAVVNGPEDEKGSSLDANILGLVKAIIGKDPQTGLSADIRLKGGLNLEVGSLPSGDSATLTLSGPIRTKYVNSNSTTPGPTSYTEVSGDATLVASGAIVSKSNSNHIVQSGGTATTQGGAISLAAGSSGLKVKTDGDYTMTVLGASTRTFTKEMSTTFTAGQKKLVVAGVDDTTVTAGSISRTVVAGSITDAAGPLAVKTSMDGKSGSFSVTAATSFSATVGLGSLSLTASGGPASITGNASVTISSPAVISVTAPLINLGSAPTGFLAVGGIPNPGGPHLDYLTGIPIMGNPTIQV